MSAPSLKRGPLGRRKLRILTGRVSIALGAGAAVIDLSATGEAHGGAMAGTA